MGNFIENEWTMWASDHNLDIHISATPHRKKLGHRVGGAYIFKDEENRRLFFRNDWTDYWGENDPFSSTIGEYRKHNQRPSWAQTFSERGKQGIHGVLRPIGHTEQGCRILSFEEELVERSHTKVIRFLDGGGSCRQVTIIQITDAENYRFRQENWVSKGKWRVIKWGWLPSGRTKLSQGLLNVA